MAELGVWPGLDGWGVAKDGKVVVLYGVVWWCVVVVVGEWYGMVMYSVVWHNMVWCGGV